MELPLVGIDWSHKGVDFTLDGKTSRRVRTLGDLLDQLDGPHLLVLETTFESYSPERRAEFLNRVATDGHLLRKFNPRQTAWLRKRLRLEKTDANDALVIYRIASDGRVRLEPVSTPDRTWVSKRETVNREHTVARFSGVKPEWSAAVEKVLGPFNKLGDLQRRALGGKSGYGDALLAAIYTATKHATNRHDFERLLGLYGNAHPSHLRSDTHHWGYCSRNGGFGKKFSRNARITWPEFRRALRWTFQQLKQSEHFAELEPCCEYAVDRRPASERGADDTDLRRAA